MICPKIFFFQSCEGSFRCFHCEDFQEVYNNQTDSGSTVLVYREKIRRKKKFFMDLNVCAWHKTRSGWAIVQPRERRQYMFMILIHVMKPFIGRLHLYERR